MGRTHKLRHTNGKKLYLLRPRNSFPGLRPLHAQWERGVGSHGQERSHLVKGAELSHTPYKRITTGSVGSS